MKLLALSLFAFVAVSVALAGERRGSWNNERSSYLSNAKPFVSGHVYRFHYDSQVSSGLNDLITDSQKSVHRLSTVVNVHFETDRSASLQLDDIRVASLNGELREIRRVQPMQLFNEEKIDSTKLEQLRLPCKFELVDGLIERISFDVKDDTWSKNIKRAVLNLLQVNMKQPNTLEMSDPQGMALNGNVFNTEEVTLEGKCQVAYTVNKVSDIEDSKVFNVTKTISFNNCSELPIIYYGAHIEKSIFQSKMETPKAQELERSTIIGFELVGSENKYAIANVELLSQYAFKTIGVDGMQTVVASRLTIESAEKKSEPLTAVHRESKDETLLYSTEWDRLEKRFYQYGDEQFTPETTPFASVTNKIKMIHSMIRKIVESTEDKTHGIETETTLKLQQIVELLRMCTIEEIEKLFSEAETKEREVEILIDACAIAGTRNTIHFLVTRMQKGDISPTKAAVVLRQFSNLPAISEKQVDMIVHLCQQDMMEKSSALRQACWLTAGSMIGEVCKNSANEKDMCPRHKKEKYEQTLSNQYKEAETLYEKILILKAIGNAGLNISIQNLEKIIVDRRESSVIRVQAIDALRRLRNEMPLKIQGVLLPLFVNTLEIPEVRMTAFSMMMHVHPEKSTMDSILYTLLKERSNHVKTFVLACLQSYTASSIPEEREIAMRLRPVLLMTKADFNGALHYYRVPIYSAEQQEGLFVNWASIFSTTDAIPKYMSLSLDSLFDGLLEKESASISFSQHNIESLYHRIMKTIYGLTDRTNIRARRSSLNGEEELESIFDNLKMQARESLEKNPFGLASLRINNVDRVVLPLAEEYMPAFLKALLEGQRPTLKTLDDSLLKGKRFGLAFATSFHEHSLKVATSSGMPLRVLHTLPVIASMDGEIKFGLQSDNYKATFTIQPRISAVNVHKMEIWCPIVNTGVEALQSLELNLPIDMEASFTPFTEEKIKLVLHFPEQKIRLGGLHTLPVTFTREYDSKMHLHGKTHVKTIRNSAMEHHMVDLVAREAPLLISGHVHNPLKMSYVAVANMLWATENHVIIDYERQTCCADSMQLTIAGKAFERVESSSAKPRFEQFYEDKDFQSVYDDDVENIGELDTIEERRNKLNTYLSNGYQPRSAYRHMIRTSFQTLGGRVSHKATAQVQAICDPQMAFCNINAKLNRSPMLAEETNEWNLKAESQFLMPEYVREVSELNEKSRRHNKVATTLKAEWGSEETQKISIKLQGERVVPQNWIQRSGDEWRRVLATAFINKYDLVADYQLSASVESQIKHYFNFLRFWNFWNVNSDDMEARTNEISATLIIDPRTRQHFNVSVKTPTERVRFINIQLPVTVKPFALIRPQEQRSEIHSMEDVASEIADSNRAECRVDGRRVKTFDKVSYKAPIGSCYSVIAKDCDKKAFAVLMKTTNEDTDAKKLKIVTSQTTIEVELISNKLVVAVNGEKIDDIERLQEFNIVYSEDIVRCNLPEGISVRFDGKQANVKLSYYYKNSQCGLCGHFDGEKNNEFRKADNSVTDDIKDFHRSYSMRDDDKCDKIYDKNTLFGLESRDQKNSNEYETKFENDENVNDYEMFDRKETSTETDELTQEPITKTITKEFNHKICFSLRAVEQCPRGSYAERTEIAKVQFACLNRSSTKARKLLRDSRDKDISAEIKDFKPSFVDTLRTARLCV